MRSYYYDRTPDAMSSGSRRERGAAYTAAPGQEKSIRKRGVRSRRRAPLVFACALVLLCGLTAASFLLGWNGKRDAPPLTGIFQQDGGQAAPAPQETDKPTLRRAPVGTGVTLTVSSSPERTLTLQELYRKCVLSVTSIRAYKSGGGATGTGVVLTADGYIITNYHVIQGADRVEVLTEDNRVFDAALVGGDQTNDLAVLKVETSGLIPAEFGDSERLRVGDDAYAIGNPLGEELRGTMTDGIISAIDRNVNVDGNTMTLIQTTAALNSGNSGGALLNAGGQVIGITNMKMMSNYDTIEGLGFAIPTGTVKQIADELIERGYVSGYPSLGIVGYALDEERAASAGAVPGVYVQSVNERSDAWAQGMRQGDVVVACQGETVRTVEDINTAKAGKKAGDTLSFRVWRSGEYLDMDIRLLERYEMDQ